MANAFIQVKLADLNNENPLANITIHSSYNEHAIVDHPQIQIIINFVFYSPANPKFFTLIDKKFRIPLQISKKNFEQEAIYFAKKLISPNISYY